MKTIIFTLLVLLIIGLVSIPFYGIAIMGPVMIIFIITGVILILSVVFQLIKNRS